jgi:hypothetical protein
LCEKAIDLFLTISNPNERLIVFFLNACAQLADQHSLILAKKVLDQINSNYKTNEFILCTAADMFIKCNQPESAEDYLSKMSKSDIKYRMLMKLSNSENEPEKTFDLYNQMKIDGFKANQITYLLLINASSRIGIENICRKTVEQIPQKLFQSLTIQNALIDMWVSQIQSQRFSRLKNQFLGQSWFNSRISIDLSTIDSTRYYIVDCNE